MGTLGNGDNLDILPRYLKDASVDLAYLVPSFNSAQNCIAFFQKRHGSAMVASASIPRSDTHSNHTP